MRRTATSIQGFRVGVIAFAVFSSYLLDIEGPVTSSMPGHGCLSSDRSGIQRCSRYIMRSGGHAPFPRVEVNHGSLVNNNHVVGNISLEARAEGGSIALRRN